MPLILSVNGLTLRRPALHFPDISLAPSAHCLLLGPSGSGKTSLLHAIAGLLTTEHGSIHIDGTDICGLSGRARDTFRASNLGIIFQALRLMPALSVMQNLLLAPYFAAKPPEESRVKTILERLGIAHKAQDKPSQLSQGEAQRAAIARAVINRPKLLLADEPTSSLDDAHCAAVMTLLMEEAKHSGASLIIATHDARIRPFFAGQPIIQLGNAA